jgi:hypothetical protein
VLAVLQRSRRNLRQDPASRAFRDRFAHEYRASLERLEPLLQTISADEAAADQAVFELYGVTRVHRLLVDAEYASTAP